MGRFYPKKSVKCLSQEFAIIYAIVPGIPETTFTILVLDQPALPAGVRPCKKPLLKARKQGNYLHYSP